MACDQHTFTTTTSAGSEIGVERIVSAAIDIVVRFEGLILIFVRQVRVGDINGTNEEGLWFWVFTNSAALALRKMSSTTAAL